MKVLVSGASGAIGRFLVPQLVEAGHDVRRHDPPPATSADALSELGARGVVVDALDREAVRRTVLDVEPEAVIDELTSLPRDYDLRDKHLYDANDEIRSKGTPALHDAAREAGARRFVMQSIAFLYEPQGGWVKSEDDPVWLGAPMPFGRGVNILNANEQRVVSERRSRGRRAALRLPLRAGHRTTPPTARSRRRSASAGSRSSAAARAWRPTSISTTPRRPPWRHWSAGAASTTSSTTSPPPVRDWLPALRRGDRRQEAAPGPDMARAPVRRRRGGIDGDRSCAARRTRRRRPSSAGSPRFRVARGLPHGARQLGRGVVVAALALDVEAQRTSDCRMIREICICETPMLLGDLRLREVLLEAQPQDLAVAVAEHLASRRRAARGSRRGPSRDRRRRSRRRASVLAGRLVERARAPGADRLERRQDLLERRIDRVGELLHGRRAAERGVSLSRALATSAAAPACRAARASPRCGRGSGA